MLRLLFIFTCLVAGPSLADENDSDPTAKLFKFSLYSQYKKPSLTLQLSSFESIFSRSGREALVFQPNFGPNLGMGFGMNGVFDVNITVPVQKWTAKSSQRGATSGIHIQGDKALEWGEAYFVFSRLKGFFLDRIKVGSVAVSNEVLLRQDTAAYEQFPNLIYQSLTMGFQFYLNAGLHGKKAFSSVLQDWPESFQWSPLLCGELQAVSFANDGPLIPEEDGASFSTSKAVDGGLSRNVAGQVGAIARWRRERHQADGSVAWGPTLNLVTLSETEIQNKITVGNAGRILLRYNYRLTDVAFLSLRASKNLRSYTSQDVTVTDSSALVEILLGHFF